MAHRFWFFGRRFREANRGEGEGGEGAGRASAAEINASGNRRRLNRMEEIAREADGRRAAELDDVNGENSTGRFAGGEFDDSPEARERAAEQADADAAAALEEQRLAAERESEEDRARALQEEGGEGEGRTQQGDENPGDEKVINGVRHYLTVVNGQERWLTLKQLREEASKSAAADQTLQRANEALQQATRAALTPQEQAPAELEDNELESVVLSAVMGDGDAVKKLVSAIKARPSGATPSDVSRQVSQQLATQRAIDAAEAAQSDLLEHASLAPIFRMKLSQFAREKPDTKIEDAYRQVGTQMRKEFAPMLARPGTAPADKAARKRLIVNPPAGVARQASGTENDQEVPVSQTIDDIAKARGQGRAIRSGRR